MTLFYLICELTPPRNGCACLPSSLAAERKSPRRNEADERVYRAGKHEQRKQTKKARDLRAYRAGMYRRVAEAIYPDAIVGKWFVPLAFVCRDESKREKKRQYQDKAKHAAFRLQHIRLPLFRDGYSIAQ